jgi:hypothetical protein
MKRMAQIAQWSFNEDQGYEIAEDSETSDGTAQHGNYQNGATQNAGSAEFDGVDDYVEIPPDSNFDLDTGSVSITFTQDTASTGDVPYGSHPAQTLFSSDSSGFDAGGHLTIYITSDGNVAVQHQDTGASYVYEGGTVDLGIESTITYSWGPDGSELIVDGVTVDTGSTAHTFAGANEPITIGASQAESGDGVADNLTGFFDGSINEVTITDTPSYSPNYSTPVACLTKGTLVRTPNGQVPVETLRVGDLVCTYERGAQPIRWLGSRKVDLTHAPHETDALRPILISSGALGQGLPTYDMSVSRQHRMLISSPIAQRMFESSDVLCAAIKLTALPGIFIDQACLECEYFHLMLDQHDIIFANDAPTETLFIGAETIGTISSKAKHELLRLFPELHNTPSPACLIPTGKQQKQLIFRHTINKCALLETFKNKTDTPTEPTVV